MNYQRRSLVCCCQILVAVFTAAIALEQAAAGETKPGAADGAAVRLVDPLVQRWQMGLVLKGGDGLSSGVTATVPIPGEWPEQKVEIVDRDVGKNVRISFRDLPPGARQMVITVPRLAPGETVQALLTLQITRSAIAAPAETDGFAIPRRTRELAPFLAESPLIESRNPKIRELADELTAGGEGVWPQIEAIYKFVQAKVQYEGGTLKGALAALESESGDCEERSSLFIALCRAKGIPARTVWVPDHCYPEFYLEDRSGHGHWIPCQSAGEPELGSIHDRRPILQKGDNFRLPEFREPLHYARATLSVANQKGRTPPTVEHVMRQVADDK